MFGQLIATLKKSPKTIVFTEGTDPRILEASARLLSGNFLKPVLVGNPEEIAAAAEDAGFNIRGAEIADPANYPEMDAMVEQMVELRKGKMTPEQCRDALKKGKPCYILEFYTSKCEYAYKVDAVSGDIIEKNIEWLLQQEVEAVPAERQESEPAPTERQKPNSKQRTDG